MNGSKEPSRSRRDSGGNYLDASRVEGSYKGTDRGSGDTCSEASKPQLRIPALKGFGTLT